MDRDSEDPAPGATPARPAGATVTCAMCPATAEEAPLTWSCAVEDGRRRYLCEACVRAQLRGIESRLDPTWW